MTETSEKLLQKVLRENQRLHATMKTTHGLLETLCSLQEGIFHQPGQQKDDTEPAPENR